MSITMFQGDTKVLVFTVSQGSGTADLTDAAIRWQLAKSVSKEALVEKSVGSGITITDAAGGVFEVLLEPEDTEALSAGAYYYEAEVTDGDDNVSTVATGALTLTRTLIKPPA